MEHTAKYNSKTKQGVYAVPVHHGEMLPGFKTKNDSPDALEQELAAKEGIESAKASLIAYFKSEAND
jgi:hypothetical protein